MKTVKNILETNLSLTMMRNYDFLKTVCRILKTIKEP